MGTSIATNQVAGCTTQCLVSLYSYSAREQERGLTKRKLDFFYLPVIRQPQRTQQDQLRVLHIYVIQHQHVLQTHTFVIVAYVLALLIRAAPQTTAIRARHREALLLQLVFHVILARMVLQ